jgi:hypothetical protein
MTRETKKNTHNTLIMECIVRVGTSDSARSAASPKVLSLAARRCVLESRSPTPTKQDFRRGDPCGRPSQVNWNIIESYANLLDHKTHLRAWSLLDHKTHLRAWSLLDHKTHLRAWSLLDHNKGTCSTQISKLEKPQHSSINFTRGIQA